MIKRNYGISYRKRRIDQVRGKVDYWTRAHSLVNKKSTREFYKEEYLAIFNGKTQKRTGISRNTKIPEGESYETKNMVIYEIVDKRDLNRIVTSFDILERKYYKTGFLGRHNDRFQVLDYIENLRKNINNDDKYWIDLGRFNGYPKKTGVQYFDFKLFNLSASFVMLRFNVFFDVTTKDNLNSYAKELYSGKLYSRREYYSGGKLKSVVGTGSELFLKQRDWFEKIAVVKWNFLYFMYSKIRLPLQLFELGIPSPSIVISDTSLAKYSRKLEGENVELREFMLSMGMSYRSTLSKNELFSFHSDYLCDDYNTMQFYYDSRFVNKDDDTPFGSVDTWLDFNRMDFFDKAAELELLDIILTELKNVSAQFVQEMNKVKMKASQFKKALKIKFEYKKKVLFFSNLNREIHWERISKEYVAWWKDTPQNIRICDPISFTYLLESRVRIEKIVKSISKSNDDKISILKSLSDVKHDTLRLVIESVTFIVGIATFVILIHPSIVKDMSQVISKIKAIFNI